MFNKYVKHPVYGFYSTLDSNYTLDSLLEICEDTRYNDEGYIFAEELLKYLKGEGQ